MFKKPEKQPEEMAHNASNEMIEQSMQESH